jgi:HAD superfamily hydrolase (TIGR01509 family)
VTSTPTNTGLKLQGVLFDMDGTLLDSEKLWDVALEDLATALGGDLSQRARQRMVGSSLARSIAIMHDDLGIDADPESSGAYLTERAAELFRTALVWKPGARQLLHAVHDAGVPAALVTSTNRPLTEIALDTLGRELFAASVCGDEVVRPKPHPEPYLTAAALIGASPEQCVAIEDSPLGIAAAEAAGCAVLAVPSEVAIEPAPTRSVRDSLAGLTVQHLAAMVRLRSDPRIEPDGQQA